MKKVKICSFAILLIALISISSTWASTTKIVRDNLSKIVMIITFDEHDQPLAIGSGFYISSIGEIATNYHIVEGATSAIVKGVRTKRKLPVERVVQLSAEHDLAVIKINETANPVVLGDDKTLLVGERIVAIGNPKGLEGTVSEGIVSGFRKVSEGFRLIQITAPISPGSSGGPVFNSRGEVIGITTASILSGQNLNFAIPISTLRNLLSKKALNQRLGQIDFPQFGKRAKIIYSPGTELIRIVDYQFDLSGLRGIEFSIFNGTQYDIKNIRLIAIFFKGKFRERGRYVKARAALPVHFGAYEVKDVIPSKLSKRIYKPESYIKYYWVPEFRVLDYEIMPSSGVLKFK